MANGAKAKEPERMVDFEKIGAIMRKNWMVMRSDRTRLTLLLFFPIIMISLFGFSTGVTPKHLAIAIADYDQSPLSTQLSQQLQGVQALSVKYYVGTESEGKKMLDEGKVKALLIIPPGFGATVESGQTATLRMMADESDSSVAQVAKGSIQAFVKQFSTQTAASRIRSLQAKTLDAEKQISNAEAIAGGLPNTQAAGTAAQKSLSLAQATLGQNTAAMRQISQALASAMFMPANPDLLKTSAFGDDFSRAVAVKEIGQDQATLGQVASYNALIAGNQYALVQAGAANAIVLGMQRSEIARTAALQNSMASLENAKASLAEFSGLNVQALGNPINIEESAPYGRRENIDFVVPSMIAMIIFQGATMGMGRAIAGERKDGSLTRVFLTPTSNTTILVGTQLFYVVLESIRSALIILMAMVLFGIKVSGSPLDIGVIIVLFASGATGIGLLLSSLSQSEEQFQPMAMLVSLPTMFLSGVFFPIQTMPPLLQSIAQTLPVYYAADALRGIMIKGFAISVVLPDVAFLAIFAIATIGGSLLVFKRETL